MCNVQEGEKKKKNDKRTKHQKEKKNQKKNTNIKMPTAPSTPIRRIVTGHDASGTAIFDDDRELPAFAWTTASMSNDPLASASDISPPDPYKDVSFVNIFRTSGFPAHVQGPWDETNRKPVPLSDAVGTTLRVVDLPPGAAAPMHRTISLDFGVVLKGEVVCGLDEGAEKVCKEGDVVVQRGTIHAWYNRTEAPARILFVLVPAEKVKVDGKELDEVSITDAADN